MQNFQFRKENSKIVYEEKSECVDTDTGAETSTLDQDFDKVPLKLKSNYQYKIHFNGPLD